MALKPCPQCAHKISDKAISCPSCGHPVAESKKKRPLAIAGLLIWACVFLSVLIVVMAPTKEKTTEINSAASIPKTDVTKSEDTEKANPTCLSDYTKCRDNEELVDRHRITKPGVCFDGCMLVTLCRRATDDASPYGDPELPWLGKFGRYRLGRSFIETGLAELVETDARVPNVFGTKVKKIIRCSVDLRSGRAIVAFD